ncbi:MAG: glycosyltransferase [Thiohalocapsa sp.]
MFALKIATIIPSYRHAAFLAEAIESVLCQSRRPEMLLVIDDGSEDASTDVLRSFSREEGFSWYSRPNRGAHATINELVDWAARENCDAISILNSDDSYFPHRLEYLSNVLETCPSIEAVSSEIHVVDVDGRPLDPGHPRSRWFQAVWSLKNVEPRDFARWVGIGNFVGTTSNLLVRTPFLKRFPFRPYQFCHDYYLVAQAILRGVFALVEAPLLNYRIHSNNTMNSARAPLLKEMLLMNLDLARSIASDLERDERLRERYTRYSRALWVNISGLHGGLLQALMAEALTGLTEGDINKLQASLDDSMPELSNFPNRALINEHDGVSPVAEEGHLVERFRDLYDDCRNLKANLQAANELAKLRNELLRSRGFALWRFLGGGRNVVSDVGKGPVHKLLALKNALRRN